MSDDVKTVLERAVAAATITRAVEVAPGALGSVPAVFARLFGGRACTVVADGNTMAAAGTRVEQVLRGARISVEPAIVFPGTPRQKPRVEAAADVAARLRASSTIPIAVGSGVINDVTKLAAELAATPYLCVPTAASMDGYAASGASMLEGGFKHTVRCAPPVAVVADLDVIAGAPAEMAGWGYGDLAGKLVAGADWVLADALGAEAIAPGPFALVQEHIRSWLGDPAGIAARDRRALGGLIDGLLISGFAMQAHGNSRPASGSDHQLAHVWEMDGLELGGEPVAHGAAVGVATVAMLAVYEWLFAQDVVSRCAQCASRVVRDWRDVEHELAASFEPALVAGARTEMEAKRVDTPHLQSRIRQIGTAWPTLRERLAARLVPAATLAEWLAAGGAVARPEDIGVPLGKLVAAIRRARLIRRRYTVLDCLDDLGWLDAALAALPAAYRTIGRKR